MALLTALKHLAEVAIDRVWKYFLASTSAVRRFLDFRLERLVGIWATLVLFAAMAKVALAPSTPGSALEALMMAFPFLALGAAPVIGYRLAAGAFPKGRISDQPVVRLARYGTWRTASDAEQRKARIVGHSGFLVSLILGILLNVPFRTLKFLAIVPAVSASDPAWGQIFVAAFTVQGAVLNFLYMTCFVMGLRSIPLFPRMLLFVWIADIASQLMLASALVNVGMPVMLYEPLMASLRENIVQVLIAMSLWLPYLLVSDQVNLLYRARLRAA